MSPGRPTFNPYFSLWKLCRRVVWKIFGGWKILGILRGSLGLCRQGRTARQHHRHRSIFSITRTLWHPSIFWSNCVLAKFAWLRIDRRMWMVDVNNVKVAWLGGGVVVHCRLAIVWSPEHFYLVALQRGEGRSLNKQKSTPCIFSIFMLEGWLLGFCAFNLMLFHPQS